MILVAREPSAFPCAAVAPAPDGGIVWRFTAHMGWRSWCRCCGLQRMMAFVPALMSHAGSRSARNCRPWTVGGEFDRNCRSR